MQGNRNSYFNLMKITINVSSIVRAIEYPSVIVIAAVLLASLVRYLQGFGFVGTWTVGYPFAFVVLPMLLVVHHYKRVFYDQPEASRFWNAVGLAALSLIIVYLLSFKAAELMFPPYNYGPGP